MKNSLTILLLLFVQLTFAEKLIFTNNNEQVTITGDADINFETGDISVTTVGEHEIINVNTQPVILGFFPSDFDVAIGSTISVNWSVAFAESCTASVSSGVASWSGAKESDNGNWSESGVSVTQLPATLQLECQNAGNVSTVETFQITEQTGGGGSDPTFNFFRVNSQSPSVTINPPGSASVSWSTTDISGCTASASPAISGWTGSKDANGTQTVTISQSGTISLTCDGIARSVDITFSENSSCSSSVYPPGLARAQGVYADFNDGFNFGESTNVSFLLTIKETDFATLSNFTYQEVDSRRRMIFVDSPTQRLMERGTISVSECPGDFTQAAACVIEVNNNSTVFITTKSADTSTGPFCKIDPTKTYYINYIMTDDPYNSTPECKTPAHTECAMFYGESL